MGLIQASRKSKTVIPCFILDPTINKIHEKSKDRLRFLMESVEDLENQFRVRKARLHVFTGNPAGVIKKIHEEEQIEAVFVNGDYTQFSINRDNHIENTCKENNLSFEKYHDSLLHFPGLITKADGTPYVVFTHFFKRASTIPIKKPMPNNFSNYSKKDFTFETEIPKSGVKFNKVHGGREHGLKILDTLNQFLHYADQRNYPFLESTRLSAHNKFGTCSIRETYYSIVENLGITHQLIAQLYWRDFFCYIMYNFPFVKTTEFKEKYRKLKWYGNSEHFELWKKGKTGFPIVDAGMRELNNTGFMHNRVRMIVASFLIKDLKIDWRLGERYFAEKLIDYDPAVNNGNWQWAASTGCDAAPYFRIFNPWIQQKKYDPECNYIKKWVDELKSAMPSQIHSLEFEFNGDFGYPKKIVDHYTESKKAIQMFRKMDIS